MAENMGLKINTDITLVRWQWHFVLKVWNIVDIQIIDLN